MYMMFLWLYNRLFEKAIEKKDYTSIKKYINKGASPYYHNIIYNLIRRKDITTLRVILNNYHINFKYDIPLQILESKSIEILKLFLEFKLEIDSWFINQCMTLQLNDFLDLLSDYYHIGIRLACIKTNINYLKYFLDSKIDPNITFTYIQNNNAEVIFKLLLNYDINLQIALHAFYNLLNIKLIDYIINNFDVDTTEIFIQANEDYHLAFNVKYKDLYRNIIELLLNSKSLKLDDHLLYVNSPSIRKKILKRFPSANFVYYE